MSTRRTTARRGAISRRSSSCSGACARPSSARCPMLARPPSYSPTPSNRSSRRSRWLVLAHLVADGVYDDPGAYERIVYLDLPNAERQGRFLSFNVLRQSAPPHTIASNVMEAMHRAWPALAGGVAPMFDTLVQNGVKALISNDLPLPALYRFLTDKDYRDRL